MSTWLATSHLRVDVGGVPAIDGLSLTSTGEHVLVLGAARALFEAAAGLRPATGGAVLIDGKSPRQAIRDLTAASAPVDPPLPGSWTVLQYTTWSARLAGHSRAASVALATESIERMQMTSAAQTKLAAAPPAMRRALAVAAALATGASTLLIEDPACGLAPEVAHPLVRATARAIEDRHTVIFGGRVPLESPLALAADEAIVVDGSDVSAQGAPAEIAASERTLALKVLGDVESFVHAVETSGGRAVTFSTESPALRPVHVRVDLGPLAARDVLRIAAASNAVVLDLRPLARAFA